LGATGEYLKISLDYINVIFLGTIFFMLTFTFNSLLMARGDTKTFRNFLIFGFILNIILDPILMFGWFGLPKLGLAGVAWATVLIQFIGMIYIGSKVYYSKLISLECLKFIKPRKNIFFDLSIQGFPAGLNMTAVALGFFIITYFISRFGEVAVAAYGIATRIEQIAFLPMIGLNIATLAIVAQNNGAKKYERISICIKKAIKYGFIIGLIGGAFLLVFGRQLMYLFSDDINVINIGTIYLQIIAFVLCGYIIMHVISAAYQGLKRPMIGLNFALIRYFVLPIIFFYITLDILNLGLTSVWYSIFFITWIVAFVSIIFIYRTLKKINLKISKN